MRRVVIGFALVLASCNAAAGSVYDEPLPGRNDTDALLRVRDQIMPQDQPAWAALVLSMNNPMASKIQSKTVGEAIHRYEARSDCMDRHSKAMDALGDGPNDISAPDYEAKNTAHINSYNKEVDGYNACLKMPV